MPRKKNSQTASAIAAIDGKVMPALLDVEEKHSAVAATYSRIETRSSPSKSFPNLDNFAVPFRVNTSSGDSFIDTQEAVKLCNKAYWAFPLLRNVIEVMVELANTKPVLKGANKRTRDSIEAWWNQVGLWQLREQFYREWFRSANCFVYRFDGEMSDADIRKMTQVYGALGDKKIPVKYIVLNPETITSAPLLSFDKVSYFKTLTTYELERFRNPKTAEDRAMVAQLDKASLKAIKDGHSNQLKLDPERLSIMLYKAQTSYEPMGVPMAYGVLSDIEAKMELKRIDLSIARTTDRALLLITVGETPNEWNEGANINHNAIAALQAAFANSSIARTLVADYTVKGSWLIPDINKILGPEKYVQLDKDINTGLNAILFSEGEKFANTSIKVQIFIERLKEARNAFLYNFLQPEVRRFCKAINAKNVPDIDFEDLSLKDELQYAKIYTMLAQLGLLTPEEMFEAMDSGKLPINDDSIQSQRDFKILREEGLYMPLIGGATEIQKQQLTIQEKQVDNQEVQIDNQFELGKEANSQKAAQVAAKPAGGGGTKSAGRPSGSKGPKSSSTPSPMGTSKASDGFSLQKIKEVFPKVSEVQNSVEKGLRKKFGLKKLSETQDSIAKQIVGAIISIEPQEKWVEAVDSYLSEPKEIHESVAREIDDICIEHDLDSYTASIFRLTKTEVPDASS